MCFLPPALQLAYKSGAVSGVLHSTLPPKGEHTIQLLFAFQKNICFNGIHLYMNVAGSRRRNSAILHVFGGVLVIIKTGWWVLTYFVALINSRSKKEKSGCLKMKGRTHIKFGKIYQIRWRRRKYIWMCGQLYRLQYKTRVIKAEQLFRLWLFTKWLPVIWSK